MERPLPACKPRRLLSVFVTQRDAGPVCRTPCPQSSRQTHCEEQVCGCRPLPSALSPSARGAHSPWLCSEGPSHSDSFFYHISLSFPSLACRCPLLPGASARPKPVPGFMETADPAPPSLPSLNTGSQREQRAQWCFCPLAHCPSPWCPSSLCVRRMPGTALPASEGPLDTLSSPSPCT